MSLACVRLPTDLAEQFKLACDETGQTQSEVLRLLIQQWITGAVSSVDEGYVRARAIAAQLAHAVVTRALQDIPDNTEDAIRFIREMKSEEQALGVAGRHR